MRRMRGNDLRGLKPHGILSGLVDIGRERGMMGAWKLRAKNPPPPAPALPFAELPRHV